MEKYDLLIKNGWVVDPKNGINGVSDIAVGDAYVRGMIRPALKENMETFELLGKAYWMLSESHLGPRNDTSGEIGQDGVPLDWVTLHCLKMRDYELSYEGMKKAILDGYVVANTVRAGRFTQLSGKEGAAVWEAAGTKAGVSFSVNLRSSALLCATAKVRRKDGSRRFVVDESLYWTKGDTDPGPGLIEIC